ncbi:MAG: hypothetical protein WCF96_05825 [Eubacteriales bacterium]
MKTIYKTFIPELVNLEAERRFFEICGFGRDRNKFQRMIDEALAIKESIQDIVRIRVAYSKVELFNLDESKLTMGGVSFQSNAFQYLDGKEVSAIYPFVMTSGEYDLENRSIMEMFYMDTWGTAYVESGRKAMKDEIQKNNPGKYVLDSFGPGFLGMPLEDVGQFFKMLDCRWAGIDWHENGIMTPLKSLAGFFVVMNTEPKLDFSDCRSCIGNTAGCKFCKAGLKKSDMA